jgi:hypothetical protein
VSVGVDVAGARWVRHAAAENQQIVADHAAARLWRTWCLIRTPVWALDHHRCQRMRKGNPRHRRSEGDADPNCWLAARASRRSGCSCGRLVGRPEITAPDLLGTIECGSG